MWIGDTSQSCVSVCKVEKFAVLSHVQYRNFGPPDPQKRQEPDISSRNLEFRSPWPILLNNRAAEGKNPVQKMRGQTHRRNMLFCDVHFPSGGEHILENIMSQTKFIFRWIYLIVF